MGHVTHTSYHLSLCGDSSLDVDEALGSMGMGTRQHEDGHWLSWGWPLGSMGMGTGCHAMHTMKGMARV